VPLDVHINITLDFIESKMSPKQIMIHFFVCYDSRSDRNCLKWKSWWL